MSLPTPSSIRERSLDDWGDSALQADTPWVIRGLAAHWPAVQYSDSSEDFINYVKSFDAGRPVCAFLGEPQDRGRFFYNEDLSKLNFVTVDTALGKVVDKLIEMTTADESPTLYVGSTHVDTWLPGFRGENDLTEVPQDALVSLWIGNQSRIAAHFDFPSNVAICVHGRRRFTLFPPEQVENLYIGPWDFTPAGQPISLVDFHEPDLARHPRFAEAWQHAQVTELEPGDAIFIPSMWWHHVESLANVNALINYWWSETPAVYGTPTDAFNHALLSIRAMPPAQRRAWKAFFDHYIFNDDDSEHLSHLPEVRRGRLGPLDNNDARQLRAQLLNALKR